MAVISKAIRKKTCVLICGVDCEIVMTKCYSSSLAASQALYRVQAPCRYGEEGRLSEFLNDLGGVVEIVNPSMNGVDHWCDYVSAILMAKTNRFGASLEASERGCRSIAVHA